MDVFTFDVDVYIVRDLSLIQDMCFSQTQQFITQIMLTATCLDSSESSSGHAKEPIQGTSYIRVHFGIPNAYNE